MKMKLEKICRLCLGNKKAIRVTASGVTRTFRVRTPLTDSERESLPEPTYRW